jgi:hypothetical protein
MTDRGVPAHPGGLDTSVGIGRITGLPGAIAASRAGRVAGGQK